MAANWQRGIMRLMRIENHETRVIAVEDFTPWYRRVTFAADTLLEGLETFPTLWLRLWVPNPTKGTGSLVQRGYTFVAVDHESKSFSLDFVLHDVAGPAGDWAKMVAPSDRVEVALTPAKIDIPEGTHTVVLAGDATALPAINSWLESVPESVQTHAFIEEDHADRELLPMVQRERGTWLWVNRDGVRGEALASAIRAAVPEQSGIYVWGAGEKTLVKNVRGVLRDHLRLERGQYFTQFYWIEGKATG